jgi:hypothetical protein
MRHDERKVRLVRLVGVVQAKREPSNLGAPFYSRSARDLFICFITQRTDLEFICCTAY